MTHAKVERARTCQTWTKSEAREDGTTWRAAATKDQTDYLWNRLANVLSRWRGGGESCWWRIWGKSVRAKVEDAHCEKVPDVVRDGQSRKGENAAPGGKGWQRGMTHASSISGWRRLKHFIYCVCPLALTQPHGGNFL